MCIGLGERGVRADTEDTTLTASSWLSWVNAGGDSSAPVTTNAGTVAEREGSGLKRLFGGNGGLDSSGSTRSGGCRVDVDSEGRLV